MAWCDCHITCHGNNGHHITALTWFTYRVPQNFSHHGTNNYVRTWWGLPKIKANNCLIFLIYSLNVFLPGGQLWVCFTFYPSNNTPHYPLCPFHWNNYFPIPHMEILPCRQVSLHFHYSKEKWRSNNFLAEKWPNWKPSFFFIGFVLKLVRLDCRRWCLG